MPQVEIFDTTLRDGSQAEGLSLTVNDKIRVAEQLDLLGVQYIEGGWPGAHPKGDGKSAEEGAAQCKGDAGEEGGPWWGVWRGCGCGGRHRFGGRRNGGRGG